jgi:hypothetical protein
VSVSRGSDFDTPIRSDFLSSCPNCAQANAQCTRILEVRSLSSRDTAKFRTQGGLTGKATAEIGQLYTADSSTAQNNTVRDEPFCIDSRDIGSFWEDAMKSFLLACVAAIILAAVAAAVLNRVQEPVQQAFATTGVRL